MPFFWGALLAVAMLVMVIFLRKSNLDKRNKYFEDLAKTLGLRYIPPINSWWQETFPSIEGHFIERKIGISMVGRGSYRNPHYYTCLSVACENGHYTFGISREVMFNKIGKLLGGQDIEIGDEAFDKTFLIKGSDVFFIKKVLDDNGKKILNNHQAILRGKLELKPNELYYEEMREINDTDNTKIFESLVKMMVALAIHIETIRD
jgi:hypothetical protein